MSIFSAPSFYAAPDRQTYSAGNYFIPQEKYTFGGVPRYLMPSGITATTAANAIPPILPINQGGGGDGGGGNITGPVDNSGFDYEYDALGDLPNKDNVGLTEEEQEAMDNMNNPGLTTGMKGTLAGMFTGFFNPLTAIASLAYQSKKEKEKAEQAAKDAEDAMNDPLTIVNKLSTINYLGQEIPVIEMHSFGSAFDLAVAQFGSDSNTLFYWRGTVYTTEKR